MLKRNTMCAVLVLLTSCSFEDDVPDSDRLGIQQHGWSINVRYIACANEEVHSVTLLKLDDDQIVGDEGDLRVWVASSNELQGLGGAGVIPTVDGIDAVLEPGATYYLEVVTSSATIGDLGGFGIDDLSPTLLRVNGQEVTDAEFITGAAESR